MTARFAVGDRVRIADRMQPGHQRTPAYVKGRAGVVVFLCGLEGQPESLGHGGDGMPAKEVYRVRLAQADLWPDYAGAAHDTLDVEIFEHWLDPAER